MFNQVCREKSGCAKFSGVSFQQLSHPSAREAAAGDLLDTVPVMSATVLGLDLLKQARCFDMRAASEIVSSDVGAVIHVLRLVGREYGCRADRPRRIAECIASLDIGELVAALSVRTFACDIEHKDLTAIWRRCHLVAQYAFLIAESMGGVPPEDAYLVGLLYDKGSIAKVLGWVRGDRALVGPADLLAREGLLPSFAACAFGQAPDCTPAPAWNHILNGAHELANGLVPSCR